jgi:ABC-type branched-subunit amino acid transport system substrate-binding protein
LIDSKDTPQEAATAFKEVINRKIKIVIGPVFSTLVEAIEKDAKKNQITVISLSNNPELSGKINDDGGVFIAGMLLETQIDKIVSYALEQGKFSFAIIAPNNQYGNTVTATFKKIVKNRDGNFITSEFYQPNDPNLDRTVKRLISSFSVPERFKLRKEALANDSLRTYPQIIFIPESGKILSKIVASIKKQNTDERDFQIIGTNQWDDISTFNDRNLVGAWFATSENEKFRNFEKIYYQSYNKFPPRISSIVYDSVAAISSLIDSKKGQLPVISNFTNYGDSPKNGFEGIDGLFRFLPNGLVQRNLAVLQVGYGRFETISKPTEKFLKY